MLRIVLKPSMKSGVTSFRDPQRSTASHHSRKRQYRDIQGYWSQKAREKRILTEKDLRRSLAD
jgi:hypothetical protein